MKIKHCWVAKQYAKGWRLGLSIGNKPTKYIQGFWFKDEKEIKDIIDGNIVFLHMEKGG